MKVKSTILKFALPVLIAGFLGACGNSADETNASEEGMTLEREGEVNLEDQIETTEDMPETAVEADKMTYVCPMTCEDAKTYEEPGQCPVCKMDLEEVQMNEAQPEHKHE